MYKSGFWVYLSTIWNYADMVMFVLATLMLPTGEASFRENCHALSEGFLFDLLSMQEKAAAVLVILAYMKLLYFFKGSHESSAFIVSMIIGVVHDIWPFLQVLLIIYTGFSIAFYITFGEFTFEAFFQRAFFGMFDSLLGNVDTSAYDGEHAVLQYIMIIVYMTLMFIIFFNVIIAVIGDGFERVMQRSKVQAMFEKAELIVNQEMMFKYSTVKRLGGRRWLHILRPLSPLAGGEAAATGENNNDPFAPNHDSSQGLGMRNYMEQQFKSFKQDILVEVRRLDTSNTTRQMLTDDNSVIASAFGGNAPLPLSSTQGQWGSMNSVGSGSVGGMALSPNISREPTERRIEAVRGTMMLKMQGGSSNSDSAFTSDPAQMSASPERPLRTGVDTTIRRPGLLTKAPRSFVLKKTMVGVNQMAPFPEVQDVDTAAMEEDKSSESDEGGDKEDGFSRPRSGSGLRHRRRSSTQTQAERLAVIEEQMENMTRGLSALLQKHGLALRGVGGNSAVMESGSPSADPPGSRSAEIPEVAGEEEGKVGEAAHKRLGASLTRKDIAVRGFTDKSLGDGFDAPQAAMHFTEGGHAGGEGATSDGNNTQLQPIDLSGDRSGKKLPPLRAGGCQSREELPPLSQQLGQGYRVGVTEDEKFVKESSS